MIGVLTGRLLAIQGLERGATPFEKKLHNLRLDMKRLKRIYVQVEEKLRAYGKAHYYRDLMELLSEELLDTPDENIDDDELSFSFVVGLNQSTKFKSQSGDETGE